MKPCDIDLSDIQPRYAGELEAFRGAARAVARDVFCEHLEAPLRSQPLTAVRATARDFGNRLLDYLLDVGDVVADADGRAHPAPALARRPPSRDVVAAYAAGDPRRSSLAYFLTACREIAGGVLAGSDGFRLVRARDPRGVMARWEHVMLEAPILEPCRAFAARALASRLSAPRVILEGGAGVGVVLRTLLRDERLAARVDRIAAYHHTDIDPALLAVGRAGIAREAPESLQRAMVYRRLDLDALARDPAASGLGPASVDCVVLEHVLYDVEDLHGTLVSLRRMLRPDGALIFTGALRGRPATFFPCEMLQLTLASYRRARLDPPYRAQVGYLSLAEWERSLSRAGFDLAALPALEDQERMPHGGIIACPRLDSEARSPAGSPG
jgi:SAM-dependent methyltransferase